MIKRDYPFIVEPLPAEEGGGYVALVPDLPGCMSDGETPEEAARNIRDAITAWIDAAVELGRPIPQTRQHLAVA